MLQKKCDEGYLFVDSNNGHCHLFDIDGNENKIKKLKKIDDTFYKCKSLMSIIIPDSVENIGDYAFYCCENLKSIVIPDSVKSIGYYAFWDCQSLKSIVIPDSVKSIEDGAFSHCKSLESIVIPNSVESIGIYAFYKCKRMQSLIFKGNTMKKVKAMDYYPFSIEDESIIKCI